MAYGYLWSSYRLPSLSFHGNRAFHSRYTVWPWRSKVNVKDVPARAASSWLISLVFHIRASCRLPSLSFHDNRASHSRDTIWPWKFKVNVKGTLVSVTFSWLISFCFPPTIPKIWQIECSTGEKRIWNFTKKIAKKTLWHNCPKI